MVPERLNYQGMLKTLNAATKYVDGLYTIEFRIYSATTGGTLLWGESYSLYVKDERFNAVLGAGGSALSGATYNKLSDALKTTQASTDRFLGLTVLQDENNKTLSPKPAECVPRQQLLPSAFAFRSQYARYADASTGAFEAGEGLTVSEGKTMLKGTVEAANGLTVSSGSTVLQGGLRVQGAKAVVDNELEVAQKTTLSAGLDVSGATILRGGATVNGDATFNGGASLKSGATINGGATIGGMATFNDTARFTKSATAAPGSEYGLRFPNNTLVGGNDDSAFLRYYNRSANTNDATLELAVGNDSDDNLALKASGNITLTSGTNGVFEVLGNVSMMKGWENRGLSQTYIESTDGFLLVMGYNGHLRLYIDDNADATSWYLKETMFFTTGGADTAWYCLPVKKGTCYRMEHGDNVMDWWHMRWMPLGK